MPEPVGPVIADPAPNFFRGLWLTAKSQVHAWQARRAQASLEKDLAQILRVVQGHKAQKLPAGSRPYQILWTKANDRLDAFCVEHPQANRDEIVAQIPALRELELLTKADAPGAALGKLFLGLILLVIGAVALGLTSGLINFGFHLVAR